jgi:hypothetical protein
VIFKSYAIIRLADLDACVLFLTEWIFSVSQRYAQFQDPACDLTLAEGLEEFYAINAEKFSRPTPDLTWFELMAAHDACHVLFGVNTSVVEEAYGDMWTLFATTMEWKEYARFAKSDEAVDIIKTVGLVALIMGTLKSIPGAFKILFRSWKMAKKWDVWAFENRLNEKLVALRKELGVEILTL